MAEYEQNAIVTKTMKFSMQMLGYCETLQKQGNFVLANQLLKSSTSIGANIIESQHGESAADFLHKMKIASKEAHETYYWLKLCEGKGGSNFDQKFLSDLNEIIKIISKIIITCKSRKNLIKTRGELKS